MRGFVFVVLSLVSASATAQKLTVFAASSLTEAFGELAAVFEAQEGGAEVLLNFEGSSTLATQITQGAPADIFASADEVQMQRVVAEGLVSSEPRLFARNRLVIVTAEGGPVTRLEDLAESDVLLVLAAPDVPVGRYARDALEKMNAVYGADFAERVLANLVSEESNVRQVLVKVELGEADAAIVYATDVALAPGVTSLAIPDDLNVFGSYWIAPLTDSSQLELGEAFVASVLSEEGQAVLAELGFRAPE